MVVNSVIHGAMLGAGYALKGWFSKRNEKFDKRKFNAVKFVPPIIVAAVIGGIAGYYGMGYETAAANINNFVAISTLELGATIFVKELLKKIKSIFP